MDEHTRQEITDLLLQQVAIDKAKEHQFTLIGKPPQIVELLGAIAKSDYKDIHPVWAIPLYLSRN